MKTSPHRIVPIVPITAVEHGDRIQLAAPPPLALYIHIPWCVKKCPYCDFNSHELKNTLPEDEYISALVADLESALPQIWGRRISSMFFGGGTPSLFSPQSIDRLLTEVRARVLFSGDAEITLEANPGTVEAERFKGFKEAGITRISLGIQSFNSKHLQALGRIHDEREAHRAVEAALAHFENVNLDIMYALPEQTLDEARLDVLTAAGYGSTHLSAYHLTIEPNTLFHHHPPPVPDPDLSSDMQDTVEEVLAYHGFGHYETSAFARPGWRCQHNMNYWTFGDYLGIGAGAHSKLSIADRVQREVRHRHPKAYMDAMKSGSAVQERTDVAIKDLPFEFMMNALRLIDGIPIRLFTERTGLPLSMVSDAMQRAETKQLLQIHPESIRPTEKGKRFLNDLLELFLCDGTV